MSMKKHKFNLVIILILLSNEGLLAQQTVNITTGQSTPGQFNDPIWRARKEDDLQSNALPASITNNVTQSQNYCTGEVFISQNVLTDDCGNWITSETEAPDYYIPSLNCGGEIPASWPANWEFGRPPDYVYSVEFDVTSCMFDQVAQLNIDWMAGIRGIDKIKLNGTTIWVPGWPGEAWHEAPISLYANIEVQYGPNILEVFNKNWYYEDYSSIMICGEIIINDLDPLQAPQNTFCSDAPAGEILSWSPAPGASEYDVVVTWNDPFCFENGSPSAVMTYSTSSNVLLLPSPTIPHSWKVRAKNQYGCVSEFSAKKCGCSYCASPIHTQCEFDGISTYELSWLNDPNAASYEIDVIYHATDCCSSKYTPSLSTYNVINNSLTLTDVEDCFSWRVRTNCGCGEDKFSSWTNYECSCPYEVGKSFTKEIPKLFLDPNPSSDIVTIHLEVNEIFTSTDENAELILVNSSGIVVDQLNINVNEKTDINVQSLISGLYICKIIQNGAVIASEKLIIQ